MKNNLFSRFSFVFGGLLLLSTSIASYTYAADVFDEELNNLLGKPVITKETLPDGSVVSTVSIGGTSADATSGFVTLPDGVKIQFTKSSSAGTTTFMNLSDGTKTVCIGKTCNGKVSVAPSFQASFSSLSQSIASNSFSSDSSNSGPVNVIVSEKVPGATCSCFIGGSVTSDSVCESAPVESRLYQCSIDKGMTAFQNMFRGIIKWTIYIIMLLGVLALVGAGILWAWGSESEEYTKKAKGWAVNIIVGLAILFTFRYILGFLAPWIFM